MPKAVRLDVKRVGEMADSDLLIPIARNKILFITAQHLCKLVMNHMERVAYYVEQHRHVAGNQPACVCIQMEIESGSCEA